MKRQVDEFITSFILLKNECLKAGYIVRDRHYQEVFLGMLKDFKKSTIELKEKMIKENDEESANTLLAVECFCEALRSEILMWLALKKEDPNKAWTHLIDAQDWIGSSTWAMFLDRMQQEEYIEKLNLIEKVVFPPQIFTSPAFVVKKAICSICKDEYGKCHHIAGKAYMGRFCTEEVEMGPAMHIAFVNYPFDKKARLTESWEKGKWQDWMTWKERRDPNGPKGRTPNENRGKQ